MNPRRLAAGTDRHTMCREGYCRLALSAWQDLQGHEGQW